MFLGSCSSLTGVCKQLTYCSDGFVGDVDIEGLQDARDVLRYAFMYGLVAVVVGVGVSLVSVV